MTRKAALVELLDTQAQESDRWRRMNRYYYEEVERIVRFHVPRGMSVLEIGCGTGDLLAALAPSRGVGIDISPKALEIARAKHPGFTFLAGDAEDIPLAEPFDYILLSDLIGYLDDVQRAFEQLNRVCSPRTRVILTYFNYLWEPILRAGERLGIKRPQPDQNWLSLADLQNLLSLAGFQTVSMGYKVLLPVRVPLLSSLCNRVLANLPLLRKLSLVQTIIARPAPVQVTEESLSCTVVIPARNEKGNIENAMRRIPEMELHRWDSGGDRTGDHCASRAGRETDSPGERRGEGGRRP
jgi:SAM-dependent methyltransferase